MSLTSSQDENSHGAHLAYTRRRTREPTSGKKEGDIRSGEGKTVRGGKVGQGRKTNPGEGTTPKKMPVRAADTRPVQPK